MVIEPGASEDVRVTFNPLGKSGNVVEEIWVVSDDPKQPVVKLYVAANVQHVPGKLTGEQFQTTIFSARCAACHGAPAAQSKSGDALYGAICVMCHGAPQSLKTRGRTELRRWIVTGNPARGMPGYAQSVGGPLSQAQIESLVERTAAAP